MTEITINSDQLKEALKASIIELFKENREEFSKLLAEIIEDVAMEGAIQEGEETEPVSREAIFKILESPPHPLSSIARLRFQAALIKAR